MASIYSIIKREIIFRREVIIFNYFAYNSTHCESDYPSQEILNIYEQNKLQWNKTYINAFKLSKYSDIVYIAPDTPQFTIGDYEMFRKNFNTRLLDELIKVKLAVEGLIISEEELKSLTSVSIDEQFCQYCGISVPEIIRVLDTINTRRIITRGRTLEIEKKNPLLGYTKTNILLVCYWCNNAKSDEYTVEEFEPIANAISQVWMKRGALVNRDKTVYNQNMLELGLLK